MEFGNLAVWDDSNLTLHLDWYKQVAENLLPAKYLICKKIAIEGDLKLLSIGELWKIHKKATNTFFEIKKQIIEDPSSYEELQKSNVDKSLMDLNVELVNRMLGKCNFCQWRCEVDRSLVDHSLLAKSGTCQLGEESRVGSFFHHRGEELIFRGINGSGTIFFTSCNMRCVFCQNGNISKDKSNGIVVNENDLATIAWLLRKEGCHNINYVGGDPIIHLHTIVRAIALLPKHQPSREQLLKVKRIQSDFFINYGLESNSEYLGEFNAPQLWNSNFFMSQEAMRILSTIIDIWLPDFKFGPNKKCASFLARTPWYWDTITKNLKMIDNWGENYVIRHLVMPNHVECCTIPIFDWISENIPHAYVNIMDQYHPDSFCDPTTSQYNPRYETISRRISNGEFRSSINYAKKRSINFESVTYY